MGWEIREATITARLSRHNDERNQLHDDLWDDLMKRVSEVVNDPKYADLTPSVY